MSLSAANRAADTDRAAQMGFVCGGNLKPVAKCLRMLGLDCEYFGSISVAELITIALSSERILLSITPVAPTKRLKVAILEPGKPEQMVRKLLTELNLSCTISPFSRCLNCNGLLSPLPTPHLNGPDFKGALLEALASAAARGLTFYRCAGCEKILWHGDHVKRMTRRLTAAGLITQSAENAPV